jgi:hypothetical protein
VEPCSTPVLVQVFSLSGQGRRRPVLFLFASYQIPYHLPSKSTRTADRDTPGVHKASTRPEPLILALVVAKDLELSSDYNHLLSVLGIVTGNDTETV